MTTLRDNAQKEGARVLEFLERHSQRVLADHGFEPAGRAPEAVVIEATAGADRRQKTEVVDEPLMAMVEEMQPVQLFFVFLHVLNISVPGTLRNKS